MNNYFSPGKGHWFGHIHVIFFSKLYFTAFNFFWAKTNTVDMDCFFFLSSKQYFIALDFFLAKTNTVNMIWSACGGME